MSKNSHLQLGQPEGRRVGNICSLLNTFLLGPATQKHRRPSVYACSHTSVIITHPSCPLFAPSRRPCVLHQLHHPFSRPWFGLLRHFYIMFWYFFLYHCIFCHHVSPPFPQNSDFTVHVLYFFMLLACPVLSTLFCPHLHLLLIFAHIHL